MARRQALAAMGIDVYVSRYDMPGAAPAVRQRLAQVKANEDASSDRSPAGSDSQHSVYFASDAVSSVTTAERASAPSQSSGVSPAKSSEQ